MTLALRFVTHSEIGLVRKNNQDSGYASPHLLVVADGMGGAAAGDLASAVAIDTIAKIDRPTTAEQMLETLAGAIYKANDKIADLVEDDFALEGMGTTVTGVLFADEDLGLAHIGDSRAYLLREQRLDRLTHDHSWVQSLVDEGKITEAEAAVHPHRSLLLRVLNGQPANEPDLTMVRLQLGDRLLLCSDGLCGLVDDPEIAEAMGLADLDDALQTLVDAALAEGGIDNITVILADVVDAGATDGAFILGAASERDIPEVETRIRPAMADVDTDPDDTGADADSGDEDTVTVTSRQEATSTAASQTATDEDDEARYAPQPPRKGRLGRPLIGLLVVLLIAAAGLGSGYAWTRTQYYVGEANQLVAIYQGVSDALPGVPLSRVYEIQPLPVADLPDYYQQMVRGGIEVADLTGARQTVAELTETAKRCTQQRATPKPTPSTPSPSKATPSKATPSKATPSASASNTPQTSATPSASPTPPPGQSC